MRRNADDGAVCLCVVSHRPKVMVFESHHVWPLGEGGPNKKENLLWLCATTHNSVHELWRLMKKYKGAVPNLILRQYPTYTRKIVMLGWEMMINEQKVGH